MSEYSDVIAQSPDDLGRTEVLQHHIDTKDAIPIRQQARRVPLPRRETVQKLLQEMYNISFQEPVGIPNCFSQQERWDH